MAGSVDKNWMWQIGNMFLSPDAPEQVDLLLTLSPGSYKHFSKNGVERLLISSTSGNCAFNALLFLCMPTKRADLYLWMNMVGHLWLNRLGHIYGMYNESGRVFCNIMGLSYLPLGERPLDTDELLCSDYVVIREQTWGHATFMVDRFWRPSVSAAGWQLASSLLRRLTALSLGVDGATVGSFDSHPSLKIYMQRSTNIKSTSRARGLPLWLTPRTSFVPSQRDLHRLLGQSNPFEDSWAETVEPVPIAPVCFEKILPVLNPFEDSDEEDLFYPVDRSPVVILSFIS